MKATNTTEIPNHDLAIYSINFHLLMNIVLFCAQNILAKAEKSI